jgi:hypothetical protein
MVGDSNLTQFWPQRAAFVLDVFSFFHQKEEEENDFMFGLNLKNLKKGSDSVTNNKTVGSGTKS